MQKKRTFLIIFLIIIGFFYYEYATKESPQKIEISRVIDGDTIELTNGLKVRLMGINSPEKNDPLYQNATDFLNSKVTNKELYLIKTGVDRYNRILGYIFVENQNINNEIIKQGYAHIYYYEKDNYFDTLNQSEFLARQNKQGLWEESQFSTCIELIELAYYDKKDEVETLILENKCNQPVAIKIKDDATHIFKENLTPGQFTKQFQNTFNDDGDTLYIWDEEGKLILYYRYS